MKNTWIKEHLTDGRPSLPFSFTFDGQSSAKWLAEWPVKKESKRLDDARTQHGLQWTDPTTGLEVRCVAVDYADYPVVEWTLLIENTGKTAVPILEQVQALDILLDGQGDLVLHHNQGDTCALNAYEPFSKTLTPGSEARFSPVGGRPTSLAFPYFNLQNGASGVIIALGWPGQWAARFAATAEGKLRIQGGQELTHLRLQPGEEMRAPLAVLMFWEGDIPDSQNLWRRWMLAHNLPRRQGKLPPPLSAMCAGLNQNEAGEKGYIEQLVRNDAKMDYWWMDAGWYPGIVDPLGIENWGKWPQVGTWLPDRERFPGGVKAVADFAHARGMRLILWFELERVSPCSLWRDHPEWLLAVGPEDRRFRRDEIKVDSPEFALKEAERNQIRADDRLFNLGNPDALRFLTDYVSKCIADWGIDIFRLDHNISPLLFWRAADAPDRQGMTENHYVCGLLKFFDELRARHPDLWIDSCASGGRRIDLETLRRTVVFTRSDYTWSNSPTGDQCQTAGIASWVPYYLCATKPDSEYHFRSNLAAALGVVFLENFDKIDWPLFRQRLAEWRGVADCFYGDYYPLSEWNNREDGRLAWQFDRPEQGDGIVQAFRRPDYAEASQTLRLRGLDPAATYEVTNLDEDGSTKASGKDLMERGLTVEIRDKPGAAVIVYRRVTPGRVWGTGTPKRGKQSKGEPEWPAQTSR
ncbi:MAG TPA: alpha-galactosidase [Planctomycetota bacterium]|nr:alpha-galactosidase [Planctomycetota bacterium]